MLVKFSLCCITRIRHKECYLDHTRFRETLKERRWIKDEYKGAFIRFILDHRQQINKIRKNRGCWAENKCDFQPTMAHFFTPTWRGVGWSFLNWNWTLKALPDCWLYTAGWENSPIRRWWARIKPQGERETSMLRSSSSSSATAKAKAKAEEKEKAAAASKTWAKFCFS